MPVHTIDFASKSKSVALLHAHWKPSAIASSIHCHPATVYRWEGNIQRHGYPKSTSFLYRAADREQYTPLRRTVLRCSLQRSGILLYISRPYVGSSKRVDSVTKKAAARWTSEPALAYSLASFCAGRYRRIAGFHKRISIQGADWMALFSVWPDWPECALGGRYEER